MIAIDILHTFVLVDARGMRTHLLTTDLENVTVERAIVLAADAVASRLAHPEEHALVRDVTSRTLARLDDLPGTEAIAGGRLPGDRLIRIFRHLAGGGPDD